MQVIDATPYRGKGIRYQAAVRAEGHAQLWVRIDRKDEQLGFFDNMEDRPITVDKWRDYKIVGNVADDAERINFGIMLLGDGKTWIDDVKVEIIDQVGELQPERIEGWYDRAYLCLLDGDTESYRKTCRELLARFGHDPSPRNVNAVAWLCVLVPESVTDLAWPVELAEAALAAQPKTYTYLNTLGVALYRAGRYDEAVRRLNEAIKAQGSEGTYGDWIFLAMAHHMLGNSQEANRWWAKLGEWIKKGGLQPSSVTGQQLTWRAHLEIQTLRREAETLLKRTQ
jgi:predicted Zn-dependent protease